jgi:hypothetical protein
MRRSFALVSWIVTLLILTAGAGADPLAVQQQLLDALARGDVAAAVALFTDDAVVDAPGGLCTKTPCVGNAAIQKDLERLVADKSRRVTTLNTYVSGNVLVTRFAEWRHTDGGSRPHHPLGDSRDARGQDRVCPMLHAGADRFADGPFPRVGAGAIEPARLWGRGGRPDQGGP